MNDRVGIWIDHRKASVEDPPLRAASLRSSPLRSGSPTLDCLVNIERILLINVLTLPALHTNFRGGKCLTYLGREGWRFVAEAVTWMVRDRVEACVPGRGRPRLRPCRVSVANC